MKRIVKAALAASMLTLSLVSLASAAKPEATGPNCADIDDGAGVTSEGSTAGRWDLNFLVTYAAPTCTSISYTFAVFENQARYVAGDPALASASVQGNGTTQLVFSFANVDDDNTVCVRATTTSPGGKVHDEAPGPNSCMEVGPNAPGGLFK